MSYKLEQPYTDEKRTEFITEYGQDCWQRRGYIMRIEETDTALYALEPDEIMGTDETGEAVPVKNPDYEAEQAQRECERLNKLTMTKRVFALGLEKFGITYSQLKELIAQNDRAQLEWELCVELERGNPLLDELAPTFNITSEQLDLMFKLANGDN